MSEEGKEISKETKSQSHSSRPENKTRSSAFKDAINRARASVETEKVKRLRADAAPEGYKWVTNEAKLLDMETEELQDQNEYLEGLRQENDVFLGSAFDIDGNSRPEMQGVYIKPKEIPVK